MSGSASEREIRDAVIIRLRELLPSARIVHELNVQGQGSNRIDVAAITKDVIVGVEIKSEKDTLKRLGEQWDAFTACCHWVIVAAHGKHFAEYRTEHQRADVPGEMQLNHPDFFGHWYRRDHVWAYPRPEKGWFNRPTWTIGDLSQLRIQPRATNLLDMLWAEELREECARHRISASARTTRPTMISDMAWMMTGREIAEAVCRQLRARVFAEADAPIDPPPSALRVPAAQGEILLPNNAEVPA